MAAAALAVLERAPSGYFLVIEGSQVAWANHANDQASQLAEMLAFDEAVGVVLEWLEAEPRRARETLVVVAPDHETGGFAINGPYGQLPGPGEAVHGAWTSGGHTATDVPIWIQGPLASRLARSIDNTEVYAVVAEPEYESVSGRRVSARDLTYWQVMAHLRWAVIALQQVERHLSGANPSLELALTGHIVGQLELEILKLTGAT